MGTYQHAQKRPAQIKRYGSSATISAIQKTTQEYNLAFFSRFSKISRLAINFGCVWTMTPGATKTKLKSAKSRVCRSAYELPIFQ